MPQDIETCDTVSDPKAYPRAISGVVRASAVEKKREGLRDGGDEHEENMGKTKPRGGEGEGRSKFPLSAITYISARPDKRFSKERMFEISPPFHRTSPRVTHFSGPSF